MAEQQKKVKAGTSDTPNFNQGTPVADEEDLLDIPQNTDFDMQQLKLNMK